MPGRAIANTRPLASSARSSRLGRLCGLLLAVTVALAAFAGAPAALAAPGDIFTVAGTTFGLSGDGGAATAAQLNSPFGVAATADGGFLIADTSNDRVRKVSPAGTITTIAGTTTGLSGDNGAAIAAQLYSPNGVAATADGGFLIADTSNDRVRKVSPAGTITTVAGTTFGLSGDGGAATAAQLNFPGGVAATADGGFLIADTNDDRVRKVSAAGTITTVAGTTSGLSGDNCAATAAQLSAPGGVAAAADGGFLIADSGNDRVRKVSSSPPPPPPPAGPSASFAGSPACVRVSKTGRFSYRFVATPAASGKVTFTSTNRVKVGSKKRKLSFAKAFTVPASGKVAVRLKLSRKYLKALKHAKQLRFRVSVSLAAKTFTTKVTLKAPKKT